MRKTARTNNELRQRAQRITAIRQPASRHKKASVPTFDLLHDMHAAPDNRPVRCCPHAGLEFSSAGVYCHAKTLSLVLTTAPSSSFYPQRMGLRCGAGKDA